jgi:hypothetical protein
MRRNCGIILCSFLAFVVSAEAESRVSVLFVGNSLTERNDLPGTFKSFAAASPLHADVDVSALTPGGALLYDHWKRGEALARLRQQRPTFLVLQGQSTEPVAWPQQFVYYARLFKNEADRIGTKTILFSTWARPAGDPFYQNPASGGTPEAMQAKLDSAYATLAHDLDATFAPVGLAFKQTRQIAPQLQLLDGSQHPTTAGTYLAAAVLFRTLFNTTPPTSSFYGAISKETAIKLQRIAGEVSAP